MFNLNGKVDMLKMQKATKYNKNKPSKTEEVTYLII